MRYNMTQFCWNLRIPTQPGTTKIKVALIPISFLAVPTTATMLFQVPVTGNFMYRLLVHGCCVLRNSKCVCNCSQRCHFN